MQIKKSVFRKILKIHWFSLYFYKISPSKIMSQNRISAKKSNNSEKNIGFYDILQNCVFFKTKNTQVKKCVIFINCVKNIDFHRFF